ncbi:hypothetical protein SAMN05421780_104300 [Flexibacter flexilis DSM 6793]|uniref:Late embryogenesis abundant protein n=1 Tax=Flexibacter flexilis DSM 6793 TaxID=927664 RepID=A0A1I1IBE3_9BACT|nr:hypothetical protein [Flexibacter flexilis]SFC33547.1 hypothetical protein SAMN05421780_104300 [Flexibacter flexilis DSM 6793]
MAKDIVGKILGLGLIIALLMAVWEYLQKAFRADQLKPLISSFSVGKLGFSSIQSLPLKVVMAISNFSPTLYNLQQIQVEIYDKDGTKLLASQDVPLTQGVSLQPNAQTLIPELNFSVSNANVVQYLFSGDKIKAAETMLKLAVGEKAGLTLRVKGFIRAEGLKIPLNEEVSI